MEDLFVSKNQLSGSIDLTSLPVGLKWLDLSENNFSGETDFSELPESLEWLLISNTFLSGEIYLQEEKRGFNVDNSNAEIVIAKYQE